MTKIEVLEQMCAFLRETVADLMLPVSVQKAGEVAGLRSAEIIPQSLPNLSQGKKKAPYIIHRVIPLETEQQPGSEERTAFEVSVMQLVEETEDPNVERS